MGIIFSATHHVALRWACLKRTHSNVWLPLFEWCGLDVEVQNDTTKTCVSEEIELNAQSMLTILGSIVNMIVGTYVTN